MWMQLARLLRAGVNVINTASFITGRGYGERARQQLEEAAQAGGVSLFGTGINPGSGRMRWSRRHQPLSRGSPREGEALSMGTHIPPSAELVTGDNGP